ncbi:MAG: chorismate mutase [Kineosporiaceae bacterium]
MALRAVRGATTVERDEREHVLERTRELVEELVAANGLRTDDVVSVVFSATPDVRSVAPALAARQLGWHDVALLCVTEMPVDGSMPLVVRLLAHLDVDTPRADLRNVYLHGTATLRADVPPIPAV